MTHVMQSQPAYLTRHKRQRTGSAAGASQSRPTGLCEEPAPRNGARPLATVPRDQHFNGTVAPKVLPSQQLYEQTQKLRLLVDVIVWGHRPDAVARRQGVIIVTVAPVVVQLQAQSGNFQQTNAAVTDMSAVLLLSLSPMSVLKAPE